MIHAFPCGTLPLDFAGTLRARRNSAPTEKLDSADALEAWLLEAGMLDHAPGATSADLDNAIALRESIYALASARMSGVALPEADRRALNDWAASAPVLLQLELDGISRSGSVSQVLASLAREMVAILGSEDGAQLRECGRPECTQVYVDRSRGHRREWCSMKTCGNRVKASTFRARQRSQS